MKDEGGKIEKLSSLRWKRCRNENENLNNKLKQSENESQYKYEGLDSVNECTRDEYKPNSQSPSEKMDDYSFHNRTRNVDRLPFDRVDRSSNRVSLRNEFSRLQCGPNTKRDEMIRKRFFKYVMPGTKYWHQFYYRNDQEKQMALDEIKQRSKYSDDEKTTPNTCEDFRNESSDSASSANELENVKVPVQSLTNRQPMQRVVMNVGGAAAQLTLGDPSLNINADPFVPRDDIVEKSVEGTTGPATGLRPRRGSVLSRLKRKEIATTPQITNDLVSILNQMDEQRMQHTEQQQTTSVGFGLEQLPPESETDTLVSAISMYNQTQASSSIRPTDTKRDSDLNNNPPSLAKEEPSAQLLINLPSKLATRNLNASQIETISQRITQLLMTAVEGDVETATAPLNNEACGQTYQPQMIADSNSYASSQIMLNTAQYHAQPAQNSNLYSSLPMPNSNLYSSLPVQNPNLFHSAPVQNSISYQPQTSQYQTQTTNQAQYRAQPIESNEVPPINVNVPPPTFQPVNEYQQMDQSSWNQIQPNQTVASQQQGMYCEPPPPPPSQSCRPFNNAAMNQTTNESMRCQVMNEEGSYVSGVVMSTNAETIGWNDDTSMGNWQNTSKVGGGDNGGSTMFEQMRVSNNESNSMTINVRGDSMMNIQDVQSNFSNSLNQVSVQQPPPPQAKFQTHPPAGILKMHAPCTNEASMNPTMDDGTAKVKMVSFSVTAEKYFID